jgi:hypothetical protein
MLNDFSVMSLVLFIAGGYKNREIFSVTWGYNYYFYLQVTGEGGHYG